MYLIASGAECLLIIDVTNSGIFIPSVPLLVRLSFSYPSALVAPGPYTLTLLIVGVWLPGWSTPRLGTIMEEYSRMDPYGRSAYEEGIDSKIVIMGNSGLDSDHLLEACCHY